MQAAFMNSAWDLKRIFKMPEGSKLSCQTKGEISGLHWVDVRKKIFFSHLALHFL